jgi:hypothetical protein
MPRPHDLAPRGAALPLAWVPISDPIEVAPATGLRPGCYRLAVRPHGGTATFHGTLRVERRSGRTIAGADLYRYPRPAATRRTPWLSAVEQPPEPAPPTMSRLGRPVPPLGVPSHPASRYDAYLRVTAVRTRPGPRGRALLAFTCEEHRYTQPGGGHGGAFVPAPGEVTLVVETVPRMPGYTDVCYAGAVHDERGVRGRVALGRVTSRVPSGLAGLPEIVAAAGG